MTLDTIFNMQETEDQHALRVLGRHYIYPEFFDDHGERVQYFKIDEGAASKAAFTMYAGARYLDTQSLTRPAIVYDPEIFKGEPDIVLDFTFAHEGYHLSSGDARLAYIFDQARKRGVPDKDWVRQIELDADRSAVHKMRDEYHYTPQQMAFLSPLIIKTTPGRSAKKARLDHIAACYGQDIPFLDYE